MSERIRKSFNLEAYACASPPRYLWRVEYSGSQCHLDPDTSDINAAISNGNIGSKSRLKKAATNHFQWASTRPSPFLSAFGNARHALNWAKKLLENGKGCCDCAIHIRVIDTSKLEPATLVFDAAYLCSRLEIDHPFAEDEFLILHQIPAESVVSFICLKCFLKVHVEKARKRRAAARAGDSVNDIVDLFGGLYLGQGRA